MENQNTSAHRKWSLRQVVEVFPIWLLGISTTSFIFGVLIVNIHLAKYGIYSTELLRTEHMLAGSVFIVLLMYLHVFTKNLVESGDKASNLWREGRRMKATAHVFGTAVAYLLPFVVTVIYISGGGEIVPIKTIGQTIGGIYVAWLLSAGGMSAIKRSVKAIAEDSNVDFQNVDIADVLTALSGVILGVVMYSYIAYPNISSTFGGGSRTEAVLYVNSAGVDVCKKLAIPVKDEGFIGPVQVLIETNNSVSILTDDALSGRKVAIQINRNLIDAVQTKTDYRYGH